MAALRPFGLIVAIYRPESRIILSSIHLQRKTQERAAGQGHVLPLSNPEVNTLNTEQFQCGNVKSGRHELAKVLISVISCDGAGERTSTEHRKPLNAVISDGRKWKTGRVPLWNEQFLRGARNLFGKGENLAGEKMNELEPSNFPFSQSPKPH